jgi:hypothetical protein
MKKLFLVLTLVLFVSSFSFAQINKGWDGTRPEVYQGSKSFIFMYAPFVSGSLGGNNSGSTINIFDTTGTTPSAIYGVGFQYFLSPNISLGGGLYFNSTSNEAQPTPANYTSKWSSSTIGINVDANYHFRSLYSVSPYFGLNLNFAVQSATGEWTTITPSSGKTEYSGNVFGAGLNLGFDWYFTPGLSLGGKYTLGFATTSGANIKSTSGATTVENKGVKYTSMGTGIASIMLNVHF